MTSVPGSRPRGFSLVELVTVLAITAILMTIAVPPYQRYLDRSHRTDAIARMMSVAGCQERLRTISGSYNTQRCLPRDLPRYAFAYQDNTGSGYTVLARPLAPQAGDPCGTLILDHTGSKRVSDVNVDAPRCWSGR